MDAYHQSCHELTELEKTLASFSSTDHGITSKDIEEMMKKFGTSMKRPEIDYMIWEVDENAGMIVVTKYYSLLITHSVLQMVALTGRNFS
jgi:Ca2+-binding EF-hand superfamily protein